MSRFLFQIALLVSLLTHIDAVVVVPRAATAPRTTYITVTESTAPLIATQTTDTDCYVSATVSDGQVTTYPTLGAMSSVRCATDCYLEALDFDVAPGKTAQYACRFYEPTTTVVPVTVTKTCKKGETVTTITPTTNPDGYGAPWPKCTKSSA